MNEIKSFYQLKCLPGFKMAGYEALSIFGDCGLWKLLRGYPFQEQGREIVGMIVTGPPEDPALWITTSINPLSPMAYYRRIN